MPEQMRVDSKLFLFVTLVLLAVFALELISVANAMSPVWDEPNGIALGYYFLHAHDYRLNLGHPPLGFMLSAVPLFVTNAPLPENSTAYVDYSYTAFANKFFSLLPDIHRAVFLARLPSVMMSMLLALIVMWWSYKLYGRAGALFSLALFVFNAAVIGNGVTAVNDVAVSFFMVLTLFLFWRLVQSPSLVRQLLVYVSFSLALLSKMTGLFILPMFLVIWLLYRRATQKPLSMQVAWSALRFIVALGAVFCIIAALVFFFQFDSIRDVLPKQQMPVLNHFMSKLPGPVASLAQLAIATPIPFPSFFVGAMQGTALAIFAPKTSFLFGSIYDGGRWYYFPIEFLLKNSLFFLLAIGASVVALRKVKFRPSELFVVVPIIIYALLFLPLNENIGIRHLLPLFPLLCIFAGRLLQLQVVSRMGRRLFTAFIALVVVALIGNILLVHPNEFSFFNELVGADNGYKYLVDGNLDQGQGLVALKGYMDRNDISTVKLSYFGSIDPMFYGINYSYLPSPYWQAWNPYFAPSLTQLPANYTENCSRTTGMVAVSATNLQNVHLINKHCFDWLKAYKPVAKAGYSIFIYNITG